MIALIIGILTSLIITLVGTPLLIRIVHKLNYGQYIRQDGPKSHQVKRGTPTLGGVVIVLAVVLVFTYQGFKYVGVAGKQISQGMEIPMMYMYGIMPVCGIICAICVVIKIITLYKVDISYFAPKNQALSRDDA